MPAWIDLQPTNLDAASVAGKVATIRSIAAAKMLPDPAPAAIANITAELRAVIGFSGKYVLDQDTAAIPVGLADLATKKIVRDMSRAVSLPLTKDEEADERTYEARLEKIRAGLWPIDLPDNPILIPPVQASTVSPLIQPRRRHFTRRKEEGM